MNGNSKKVLAAVVQILKDNAQITQLSIEGNTDNEGEPKFDNANSRWTARTRSSRG